MTVNKKPRNKLRYWLISLLMGFGWRNHALMAFVLVVGLLLTAGTSPVQAQGSGNPQIYVVSWGDTVASIASRYGVTISSIVEANDLSEPNQIFAGQHLVIPGLQSQAVPLTGGSHTVSSGENLFRISLLYDVSVEALMSANDLTNPNQIRAGQQLIIPTGGTTTTSTPASIGEATAQSNGDYIVQPGDTVFGISRKFGVSASALADTNNLLNPSAIYSGQRQRPLAMRLPKQHHLM